MHILRQIIFALSILSITRSIHTMEKNNGQLPLSPTDRGFFRGTAGEVVYNAIHESQMQKLVTDFEAQVVNGETPLHLAALEGQIELAKYLLEKGANIEVMDSDGRTPLYYSVYDGKLEMVKFLLNQNANIKTTDLEGVTPLHMAANTGQTEVAKLLLLNGADIDAQTLGNETPLHSASFVGHARMVKLLLECGANKQAEDKYGLTPFDQAICSEQIATIRMFLYHGQNNSKNIPLDDASRTRIKATLEKRRSKQLTEVPFSPADSDDANHLDHATSGSNISQLVSTCPFAWFKQLYDEKTESKKAKFLNKVLPAMIQFQLDTTRDRIKLLHEETDLSQISPEIGPLFDLNDLEQHRKAIEKHIRVDFTGQLQELELIDNNNSERLESMINQLDALLALPL